jgi:hypothetical protein
MRAAGGKVKNRDTATAASLLRPLDCTELFFIDYYRDVDSGLVNYCQNTNLE